MNNQMRSASDGTYKYVLNNDGPSGKARLLRMYPGIDDEEQL